MFAARAQHVRETLLPALQRGAWVLSRSLHRFQLRLPGRRARAGSGVHRGARTPLRRRAPRPDAAARPRRAPGPRTHARCATSCPTASNASATNSSNACAPPTSRAPVRSPQRIRVIDASPSADRCRVARLAHLRDHIGDAAMSTPLPPLPPWQARVYAHLLSVLRSGPARAWRAVRRPRGTRQARRRRTPRATRAVPHARGVRRSVRRMQELPACSRPARIPTTGSFRFILNNEGTKLRTEIVIEQMRELSERLRSRRSTAARRSR